MRIRAVVVSWLLLLALASGCGQESAAQSSGPAGKVVELSGTATATRGGAARPLAVGSDIFADDEVATADGAEIAISLTHNGARWVLGGGQKRKLIASAAWRAEPGSALAAALDEDDPARTAAAGRHSEREAADTAANAEPAVVEAEKSAVPESGAPPAAAPVPPAQEPAHAEAAPAPRPDPKPARPEAKAARRAATSAGAPPSPPPPPPQMEPAPDVAPTIANEDAAPTTRGGGGDRGGSAGAAPTKETESATPFTADLGGIETVGSLTANQARERLNKMRKQLTRCTAQVDGAGAMSASISVGADGKVTAVKVESADAALSSRFESCAASRLRAVRFPAADSKTQIKLTITVR